MASSELSIHLGDQTSGSAGQNGGILIATVETVGTDTGGPAGAGDVCLDMTQISKV